MKLEVKLPCIISAEDYHEFSYIEEKFKLLNKKIKVKELNDTDKTGYYAIVFTVKFNSLENKSKIKNFKRTNVYRYL